MNIVLVNRWYPPHTGNGGVATYNHVLARRLKKLGNKVTVIAARNNLQVPADEETEGVRVIRLHIRHRSWLRRIPILGYFSRTMQHIVYSMRIAATLLNLQKRERVDAVEFADVGAEGLIYMMLRQPAAVIIRCHTPTFILRRYYSDAEVRYETSLLAAFEKWCIRHADTLTTPSLDMAEKIESECGVPAARISVVPNPVEISIDVERKNGPEPGRSQRIIYVGRLDRAKGIETLAEAAARLYEEKSDFELWFVGDDCPAADGATWAEYLKSYFENKGMQPRVRFLHGIDDMALRRCYAESDIAVIPSLLYESFSYTCAQAMCAGLPVVASRIGGIPETIRENETGFLVRPADICELKEAVLKLLIDPVLGRRMGAAGRRRVQELFGADHVCLKIAEIYEKAIAAKKLKK